MPGINSIRLRDSKGHFITPKNRAERRHLASLISQAKVTEEMAKLEMRHLDAEARGARVVWFGDQATESPELEMVRRWHIRQADLKRRGK